jgi:tetratricopeptide (TPR) repeat protein
MSVSQSQRLTFTSAMTPLIAGAMALGGCVSVEPSGKPHTAAHAPASSTEAAWKEFEAGNLDESRSRFESLTQEHPADSSGHFGLGRVALARGQQEEAVGHFQQAITLNDTSAAHWAYLGTAQLQLERNPEALASLQKALSLDPKQGQALVGMAEYAMTVEDNFDKALQHLEQAKASGFKGIPPGLEPAIRQRLN